MSVRHQRVKKKTFISFISLKSESKLPEKYI